jgi:hypothetical protein
MEWLGLLWMQEDCHNSTYDRGLESDLFLVHLEL